MTLRIQAPVLALQQGEVITLDDARGVRILSRAGTVWVTEEGNPRDHILGPGESLVVGRIGRIVVQALQQARVALRPAAETARLALETLAPPRREEQIQELRHRIDARYY